jgi:hypothetical protein
MLLLEDRWWSSESGMLLLEDRWWSSETGMLLFEDRWWSSETGMLLLEDRWWSSKGTAARTLAGLEDFRSSALGLQDRLGEHEYL